MLKINTSIQAFFLLAGITCLLTFTCSGREYYVSGKGNDQSAGTGGSPWKSINKVNTIRLLPGDKVFFEGGYVYFGTLVFDSLDSGSGNNPVRISSYGKGKALLNGRDSLAVLVKNCRYIQLTNIACAGSGRKSGNRENGIGILFSSFVSLDRVDVFGFQKAGVMIYSSDSITLRKVESHDNGYAGIAADGEYQQRNTRRIHMVDCRVFNNPGDPSNLDNHSGNGIVVGNCRNVCIEYCVATGNGWDMPRTGNGPVGIWGYEADSLVIQHCISYRNRTSKGGGDGGGFDLDGGVTRSVIQYCLSYENEGSGFGIFQYDGASPWHHNTFRFNISINDGAVSPAQAAIFIWNSSMDTAQFRDCLFYNNTIYNEKAAVLSYEPKSANAGFLFLNNIFIGKDELITGKETNSTYLGNCWYSLDKGFRVGSVLKFRQWADLYGKEQFNGKRMGANLLLVMLSARNGLPVDPRLLLSRKYFQVRNNFSKVTIVDLESFAIQIQDLVDYYGKPGSGAFPGAYAF